MKRAVFCALVAIAMVLLLGTAAGALATDRVQDSGQYDPKAEQVFIGTVQDKPALFEGRMYFTLDTRNGAVTVEIGPKEFVDRCGLKLVPGQMITVIGVPIVGRHPVVVLARELTVKDSGFTIRDRNGEPRWDVDRPIQMDPEVRHKTMPIC